MLKAHLGVLKTQSSKPQGLSALFGKTKAHLTKHALDMFFLALFEGAQSMSSCAFILFYS